MENKLEQLLNMLIKRGWKPFGDNAIKIDYDGMKTRYGYGAITYKYRGSYIDDYGDEVEYEEWRHQFNNRELVSKESGLWQFVCDREHRFIDKKNYEGVRLDKRLKNPYADYDDVNTEYEWITSLNYKYWIIESSLKDESELEDFLLSNIKIGNED